ncbi:MAG: recombinase family protein [Cryomorphaceae bacterium]
MRVGYARVSTTNQNIDLQMDALKTAVCENIFSDGRVSGKAERLGLDEALTRYAKVTSL